MLKGSPVSTVAKHFNCGVQTIRDIKKKEADLDRFEIAYSSPSSSDRLSLRVSKLHHVDQATYTWFRAQRAEGVEVSGMMLKLKSVEFNKFLGGSETFTSSNGWLDRFQKRHGIRNVKLAGECADGDLHSALEYATNTIPELLKNENITLPQLYNGDETGLIYRKTPNSSLVLPSEKRPSGKKQSKERVTILVGANADGSDKLPLVMIGKSQKPRCFNKVNPSSIPLHYLSQRKAWMTAALFIQIFTNIWVPHIKKSLKKRGLPQRAVVLFDNATSHEKIEIDGIKALFLPKNTTSLIQPMDQGPIAALKRRYMSSFMQCVLDRDDSIDMSTFVKKWDLLKTSLSLATAWSDITDKTLKNAWKRLLINVHSPDPVPEEVEEVPVPDPCPEIQEWMDEEVPTSEELTDEAIVQAILNSNQEPEQIEDDEDDQEAEEIPEQSLKQLINTTDDLLQQLMRSSKVEFDSTDSLYFAALINKLKIADRNSKVTQTSLSNFFDRI